MGRNGKDFRDFGAAEPWKIRICSQRTNLFEVELVVGQRIVNKVKSLIRMMF